MLRRRALAPALLLLTLLGSAPVRAEDHEGLDVEIPGPDAPKKARPKAETKKATGKGQKKDGAIWPAPLEDPQVETPPPPPPKPAPPPEEGGRVDEALTTVDRGEVVNHKKKEVPPIEICKEANEDCREDCTISLGQSDGRDAAARRPLTICLKRCTQAFSTCKERIDNGLEEERRDAEAP